jgi:DNA-directed RNA polymerase subunit beta'
MGRLIPAGTGMKYYRNVKVDYDPTMNQKVVDEYDEEFPIVTGGMDLPLPMDVPGVEIDEFEEIDDLDDFEDEEIELDTEEIPDVLSDEIAADEDDF